MKSMVQSRHNVIAALVINTLHIHSIRTQFNPLSTVIFAIQSIILEYSKVLLCYKRGNIVTFSKRD